jgi:hypothetical protein
MARISRLMSLRYFVGGGTASGCLAKRKGSERPALTRWVCRNSAVNISQNNTLKPALS